MKIKYFAPIFLLSLIVFLSASYSESTNKIVVDHSEEELKLHDIINAYRAENNLEEIPLSKSLSYVAQKHCKDLDENSPDLDDGCNVHSWSANGIWSSCCYTEDHKQAQCMWSKPSELTNYKGYGFEIAVGSSDSIFNGFIVTAEYSLESWKKSFHHNNVILNRDSWKNIEWKAMGVGIYKGFSSVWFGREVDSEK